MKKYHIVAASENGVIVKENRLPWHFSSDMKHFKETTGGATLVMGRKTFESIGSKPLPNRENFVLSRSDLAVPEGVRAFKSLDEAYRNATRDKIFVIGGAQIYRESLKDMDGIYLTRVSGKYEGDAFYPEIPEAFCEKSKTEIIDNGTRLEFIFYEKNTKVSQ